MLTQIYEVSSPGEARSISMIGVDHVVLRSLRGGPAFETEENMALVFAFLSAGLAPFGKAALD